MSHTPHVPYQHRVALQALHVLGGTMTATDVYQVATYDFPAAEITNQLDALVAAGLAMTVITTDRIGAWTLTTAGHQAHRSITRPLVDA